MKKRIVSFLCLIIMLAICLASCKEAVSVTGAEVNADGDLIITMSDGTTQNLGKVKGADGQSGSAAENPQCLDFYPLPDGNYAVSLGKAIMLENIVIPATYQGKSVTKVINPDFNLLSQGEKPAAKVITLPDTITSLGNGAFAGCKNLESINIPSGVNSIGYDAFHGCSSLESVNIPSGVTSIGNMVFYGCSSLESVNIPSGVTSIGDSAFDGCSSLESVTIPNSVTSIGDSAFYDCSSLTSVTFEDPNGWSAGNTGISATDLQETDTAAYLLTNTYKFRIWTKTTA